MGFEYHRPCIVVPTAGIISSPLLGSSGNQEYLVWLSRAVGGNPTEWSGAVAALL